jgi:uncharacterized protein (TIGR00255 family)
MIKSMTGFAHQEIKHDSYEISIDIRSLNHRYCEINLRIPPELANWEEELRKITSEKISRGMIDIYLKITYLEKPKYSVTLNREALQEIWSKSAQLQEELKIPGQVDIHSLLLIPHVIEFEQAKIETEPELLKLIKKILLDALQELDNSRKREGANLSQVVEKELHQIDTHIKHIEQIFPSLQKEYYSKLKEKIEEYVSAIPLDENRLLQEVALLAEKSDISEEITRVKSHLEQCQQQLLTEEPVGRKLDFLMQELYREASTIGAKCRHSSLLPVILAMKASIEKIRQQVQNIE